MKVCGVIFKENSKVYNFDPKDFPIEIGKYVIVITERGEQIGKITTIEDKDVKNTLKEVVRMATDKDYNQYLINLKDAQGALKDAKAEASRLDLKMQLVDSEFTFDRKQLYINFVSDERVDFRELVKFLAGKYKTRIELHQMGARDKAKKIGGIGICGRKLCCAKYLNKMDTISINMAKNQNIALTPSKINGCCGRLLCCLAYEDETYKENKEKLPKIGSKIKIDDKIGTVVSINVLSKKYKVTFENEVKEFTIDEAEKAEHFSKTVTIYCNADNSPLRLKVTGNAE